MSEEDLPLTLVKGQAPQTLHEAEKDMLLARLRENGWHVQKTAKTLGISRATLYRKLKMHDLFRTAPFKIHKKVEPHD